MNTLGLRGLNPSTAMRDTLRQLERAATYTPPAEPETLPEGETGIEDPNDPALDIPPPYTQDPPEGLATPQFSSLSTQDTTEPAGPVVQVGSWQLSEDLDTGDLVATHADGTTRVVATKGNT